VLRRLQNRKEELGKCLKEDEMASEMESIREEAKESRRISSLIEDILDQVRSPQKKRKTEKWRLHN